MATMVEPAVPRLDRSSALNVRHHPVGQRRDFIFQHEFALLQPREFELVAIARQPCQFNFKVEPAVLAFQHGHKLGRIIVVHRLPLQDGRPAVTGALIIGQSQRVPAEAMWNGGDSGRISWFSHSPVTRQPTKGN